MNNKHQFYAWRPAIKKPLTPHGKITTLKDTKLMGKVKIEHPKPCSDELVMKKSSRRDLTKTK